ncbi:RagB/SusD family nutrient uptake outer membrane protein [Pedobacter nototheniae]|uniref:RagB/SusD family nutrient uptake outer membrane protein n=1 Tax=Pedobacter nototheniae TaxID=2488994 RepID=UPI00292EBE69|nr:RagB/SusD family nutrient uptake outer membrane protein [Pedobacter nototheniae]
MKIIYQLIFALLIIGTISSCKKYLDVKSNATLVIPHTLKDAQSLLDDATLMNIKTTPSYGETSADDYFLTLAGYNAAGTLGQDIYVWKAIEYLYGNDWSYSYLAVYNTNLSLDILNKIDRNEQNAQAWDNVKGSALFFRSFYFLGLLTQYAFAYDENTSDKDLGVVLRLNSDFNEPSSRASVKQCYDQVINDLLLSLNYLPDYSIHQLRPSKGAAYALLARAYLYKRQYDLALKYSSEALKLNSQLMDYNADPGIISPVAAVPFRKFNKETIFYSEMFSFIGLHNAVSARIDTNLYATYNANDLRRTIFFKASGSYQVFKGSYAASAATLFSGLSTDELYITRAECRAYLNDVPGSMDDLNLLLKKRWKNTVAFVPLASTNRSDALNKIRLERRKELVMRNMRWIDVKRYNKEGGNIIMSRLVNGKTISILPDSRYYALPLPTDIIQQTGMPQN